MMRRALVIAALVLATGIVAWLLFVTLPRRYGPTAAAPAAAAAPTTPAPTGRKIKARLFYVADDGVHLKSVEHDVAYGEGALEQAREIVAAQIAPVSDPLLSAIPANTTLRALFISTAGEAYVDFSSELVSGHTGGTADEILTVYTIVNAITENLPSVTGVQLLVNGKEMETLAGHIDLRSPLAKNLTWVR